ncbi:hypothetical protein AAD018_002775 [Aestuariibius insulae]|uniref:hypothetical protein n=1 Tax=Aestuariibius insulae TaxID=2058287 RepID=UPI00345EAB5D
MWQRLTFHDRKIDPAAFFFALVAAPLAPTAAVLGIDLYPAFVAVALISIVAVYLGVVPYLILGTPLFLCALLLGLRHWLGIGLVAVFANAVFCASIFLSGEDVDLYLSFGTIFAFIWGALFAVFYRTTERPQSQPK